MKILNVAFIIFGVFNKLIFLTKIATFVESHSIYDEILPVDLTGTRSYVVFDLFHDSDNYYPLGLSVKTRNVSDKEFSVDDLIVFGKDVKIVFGDRCVSLSPFAKNITMSLSTYNLKYIVEINYDLQGSKITKKYKQTALTLPGDSIYFKFVEVLRSESVSDLLDQQALEYYKTLELDKQSETDETSVQQEIDSSQGTISRPTAHRPITAGTGRSIMLYGPTSTGQSQDTTQSQSAQTPEDTSLTQDTPASQDTALTRVTVSTKPIVPSPKLSDQAGTLIEITRDNLSGTDGYEDCQEVKAGPLDFRCVLFKNTNNSYDKLSFKNHKLNLSKDADSFEICYTNSVPKTNSISAIGKSYHIVVSSQFSAITVEQFYKFTPGLFSDTMSPLYDYNFFGELKTYPERKVKSNSQTSSTTKYTLNMDTFVEEQDSFLEKVDCGKCVVYRYIDGLETENRVSTVTGLKFGNYAFKIPEGKRFVMASLCTQYLTTKHVSVMLRDMFLYENYVFYSVDGSKYQERKYLEDEERFQLINLTSKVWHKRESSGKMDSFQDGMDDEVQVLCLNQFVKTKKTRTHKACKKLSDLDNFKLLYTDDNFTNLAFKQRAPKSSVIVGNVMFDLKTDNEDDKFIYISHSQNEPINVLVLSSNNESFSVAEKTPGSNLFGPMTDSLSKVQPGFSKKHLNIGVHMISMYDITWNFSDYLKRHYLYPSQFPQYCLGDIVFRNVRILSHKDEGYKQISAADRNQLNTVTVTTILGDSRLVLAVSVDDKRNTAIVKLNKAGQTCN
uniref:Uncharacterized protein n=1 Tax=Theileria annulata TaxID=5874 RepID=A0A3B0MPR4_THEAN